MSKAKEHESKDIDICKRKIQLLLTEYNCEVQTDDYHSVWLYDKDTEEIKSLDKTW